MLTSLRTLTLLNDAERTGVLTKPHQRARLDKGMNTLVSLIMQKSWVSFLAQSNRRMQAFLNSAGL